MLNRDYILCSSSFKYYAQHTVLKIGEYPLGDTPFYIITKSMRTLIGQSAVSYCAGKPTEKLRVF